MKITLVNSLYSPCITGGAQKTVQRLAEYLARDGHTVIVIAISETGEDEHYELNGVSVIKVPIANSYNPYADGKYNPQPVPARALWHLRDTFNLPMARKLMSIEAFRTADVLFSHCLAGFSVSAWAAAARCGRPMIGVLHDYYALCARSAMYDLKKGAPCPTPCLLCATLRLPARRLSRHVDVVIGVSHFILKKHLMCGYFPNAVPLTIHNAYDSDGDVIIEEGRRPRRFGYLGSLIPEKGLDLLIEAFKDFGNDDAELHVFGQGKSGYVEGLKAKAAGAPIYWEGVVETEAALAVVDVLVVPSLWDEPFGRVVIEALSSGVPVIGASRGGITEILADATYSALFEPSDKRQLVAAFERYVATAPEEFMRARKAAVERGKQFSGENDYAKYLSAVKTAYVEGRARRQRQK